MAKIITTYDTIEKTVDVTVDGTALQGVYSVSVNQSWREDDEFQCCVTSVTQDAANDMKHVTQVCACADQVKIQAKPGMTKLEQDVASYFAKKATR